MDKGAKNQLVDNLSQLFQSSIVAFTLDGTGLNVGQVTAFRRKVRAVGGKVVVAKNTFGRISSSRALSDKAKPGQLDKFHSTMKGPSMFVFSTDPVTPAKAIIDFAKDKENADKFKIKGGIFEGEFLDSKAVEDLSKMPGKAETMSALLRVINAPARQLLRTINAPGEQMARVVEAYRAKLEKVS
jgi:large subunit ribosomal protein L10